MTSKFNLRHLCMLLICGMVFIFVSCGDDDDPDPDPVCDTTDMTYNADIKTILDTNCATSGCHVSGFGNGSLANYDDAVAVVGFGKIIGSINHSADAVAMPPSGIKLADCSIDKIEAWIAAGTPE